MARIKFNDLHRNRFIRILLTENCNASCTSCFNADFRSSKHMDFDDFKDICTYFSNNGVDGLKVMGGEPTVHPRFEEAIEFAQRFFNKVNIFTNALNDRIKNIKIRDHDSIIYNFNFIDDSFDWNKLLPYERGIRILEVQISSDINPDCFIKRLYRIFDEAQESRTRIIISFTLNCMENIFTDKKKIIYNWNRVAQFVENELKQSFAIDHVIPRCFYEGSNMALKEDSTVLMCEHDYAGLIDSRLNLRHCNQYPAVLLNMRQEDGRFIPYHVLESYVYKAYMDRLRGSRNKICGQCIYFNNKCNGGCFMHNDYITKEDVLANTDLSKDKIAAFSIEITGKAE